MKYNGDPRVISSFLRLRLGRSGESEGPLCEVVVTQGGASEREQTAERQGEIDNRLDVSRCYEKHVENFQR